MKNIYYLRYTYMHRRAIEFVISQITTLSELEKEALMQRTKWHDLDKSFLYTLIDKEYASDIHKKLSSHHMENEKEKTELDKLEAVLNYESAGYTKEDKPRNAFDTVRELTPELMDTLLPIMKRLGIASSYKNTPENEAWKQFIAGKENPTEEMIMDEIYQYIFHHPQEAYHLYLLTRQPAQASMK